MPDQNLRDFARAIFTDPDAPPQSGDTEQKPDPERGNVVPAEGSHPEHNHGGELRDWTRALFDRGSE